MYSEENDGKGRFQSHSAKLEIYGEMVAPNFDGHYSTVNLVGYGENIEHARIELKFSLEALRSKINEELEKLSKL